MEIYEVIYGENNTSLGFYKDRDDAETVVANNQPNPMEIAKEIVNNNAYDYKKTSERINMINNGIVGFISEIPKIVVRVVH